jgi:CDP-glycerol glycerophosphotransferase (TagB/SpsB family)
VKESSLVKVGLPILEDPEIDNCTIEQYFGLNSINKRTILYAPSWANQIEIVSDIESIIKYLERLAIVIKINIVISPHPMLFQPEKCSGLQFFKSVYKSDNVSINKPDSPISTLDLVKYADITISDISSILFEAMGMNKLVIFDGNRKLYESSGSIDLYDQILNIFHVPEWESDNYSSILEALENDVLLEKRQLFISEYIFNLGAAKNVFINNVLKIIHS